MSFVCACVCNRDRTAVWIARRSHSTRSQCSRLFRHGRGDRPVNIPFSHIVSRSYHDDDHLFNGLHHSIWCLLKNADRGKFGTVFKCREKKTGLRLAAKFVQAAKKADRINVEREVEIMKSLRNPRLIQLYDAFDDGKKEICLLLEL